MALSKRYQSRIKQQLIHGLIPFIFFITASFTYKPLWLAPVGLYVLIGGATIAVVLTVAWKLLSRAQQTHDRTLLILATAFLGTSVLDGYHFLFTLRPDWVLLPGNMAWASPWSWFASHLYLALMLCWGYFNWQYEQKADGGVGPGRNLIWTVAAGLCLLFLSYLSLLELPQPYSSEWAEMRAQEFIPALIFFFALLAYSRPPSRSYRHFTSWLAIGISVNLWSLVFFMGFSHVPQDLNFTIAHLFNLISYLCVLKGATGLPPIKDESTASRFQAGAAERPQESDTAWQKASGLGLGVKATIIAGLLVLVIAIPIVVLVYQAMAEMLVKRTKDDLAFSSERAAEILETEFLTAQSAANLIAGAPPVAGIVHALRDRGADSLGGEYTAEWRDDLYELLSLTMPNSANALYDNGATISGKRSLTEWRGELYDLLSLTMQGNTNYRSISFVLAGSHDEFARLERRGTQLRIPDDTELSRFRVVEHIRKSWELNKDAVRFSGFYGLHNKGRIVQPFVPLLVVVVPAYSENQLLGLVVVQVDMSHTLQTIALTGSARGTRLYVADGAGTFLVHPDSSKLFGDQTGSGYQLRDEFPRLAEELERPEGLTALIEPRDNNADLILGYAQLQSAGGFSGKPAIVIHAMERTLAEAPAAIIGKRIKFITAIVLPLACLFGWVAAQFLVRPIRRIARVALRFGKIQQPEKLPLSAPGELGLLAQSVAKMMDNVNQRTTDLRNEVIERQIAEQTAHASDIRHRAIIDSMRDAHIVSDKNGVIQDFNPAAEYMFGHLARDVIGKNVSILMPEPFRSEHSGYLARHNEKPKPQLLPVQPDGLQGIRGDGSRFPIHLSLSKFSTARGAFFSAIIRDITKEKQAKEALHSLEAAVESAADCIIIMDHDGVIEYTNPAHKKHTGYSAEEAVGMKVWEVQTALGNRDAYEELKQTVSRGQVWSGQIRTRVKDGRIVDEQVTISPIRDSESGKVTSYVAVKRDITEQLQMEQQLRAAQKLESIGQLAAGIAHEINTPTQYIGDNTRFLQDAFSDVLALISDLRQLQERTADTKFAAAIMKILEAADVEYLQEQVPQAINQSLEGVERVANIVRAMKEFSHPAQEKMAIDLNRAIQSTLTVATNEWKYVADIETDFDPALPPVPCLPGEFNQVILNITVNAAHAIANAVTDGNKGTISISTREVDGWAEIRISDTGNGMTEKVRHRIFDPFFTTKEVGKGTGQGLSIAYNVIVEKHHGTIEVDSAPGKGACFIIRLPIDEPEDSTIAAA